MFLAGRSFEQVRNSVGYPHINVKLGVTHAGATVGEDATHQCNEDIALMRTIPRNGGYQSCGRYRGGKGGRGGNRARRSRISALRQNGGSGAFGNDYDFKIGRGTKMAEGNDVSIICAGIMVEQALGAREILAPKESAHPSSIWRP